MIPTARAFASNATSRPRRSPEYANPLSDKISAGNPHSRAPAIRACQAVAHVEALHHLALLVVVQAAIGEHAVNVTNQQFDRCKIPAPQQGSLQQLADHRLLGAIPSATT